MLMKCEEEHNTFQKSLVCDFSESFNYTLEMRYHSIGRDLVQGGGDLSSPYTCIGGGGGVMDRKKTTHINTNTHFIRSDRFLPNETNCKLNVFLLE